MPSTASGYTGATWAATVPSAESTVTRRPPGSATTRFVRFAEKPQLWCPGQRKPRAAADADTLPAIEAGATGYLLKDAPPEDLAAAVRTAAAGRTTLAPAVAAATDLGLIRR